MVRAPVNGTLYTFRLKNGFYGACRVLRGPRPSDPDWTKGHVLVCATRWVGSDPTEALNSPRAKQTLRGAVYWLKGSPTKPLKIAGVLRTVASAKPCHFAAPWGVMPNVVFDAWHDDRV